MTGKLKYAVLIKPGIEDALQPGYRSMRYDPMVWNAWKTCDEKTIVEITKLIPGGNLNPGNFALYQLNPELIKSGYPETKIDTTILEDCMNEFQLFLQDDEPPIDLVQAAKFAIVLIEKRRISDNWNLVLAELSSRFRGSNVNDFVTKWRTVIGIVENLTDSSEELFTSMGQTQSGELARNLFLPALMMVSQPDKEKLDLAMRILENLTVQEQLTNLRSLVEIGEEGFAADIAKLILKKYSSLDLSSKPFEAYWDRSNETLSSIPFHQSLAMIAHITNDENLEGKILSKTSEMLVAAQAAIEIQKSLLVKRNTEIDEDSNLSQTDREQVNQQLSFFEDPSIKGQGGDSLSAFQTTMQAKNMATSGNEEVGLNSVMDAYSRNPEGFVNELLSKRPRFDPNWQAAKIAKNLVEIGAYIPAEQVLRRLIKENPGNLVAVQSSIKLYKETGKLEELAELLEGQVFGGTATEVEVRELIGCDLKLNKNEDAYEVSELLLEKPGVTIDDKIQHAAISLNLGKIGISRKLIEKVLVEDSRKC